MNLIRLRRACCRQLGILPNNEVIQRKAAADMIAVIDEALDAQKAADALAEAV